MLYYGNLSFYIPNGYNYGSYRWITNGNTYGTLLDYGYDTLGISFKIGLGPTQSISSSSIVPLADENYEFIIDLLLYSYPTLGYQIFDAVEAICESENDNNCTYYSNITFKIACSNYHMIDYKFNLKFDPGFDNYSEYTFLNL